MFDLAAAEFENREYDKAFEFENRAQKELKKAHSDDHAHVDSYIKALHFCRIGYIIYEQGKKQDAQDAFHKGLEYFHEISDKDCTHDMRLYFAQARFSRAIMFREEKEYARAIEQAEQAIRIINHAPSMHDEYEVKRFSLTGF